MKYVIIVSILIGIAVIVDIIKTNFYLRRLDKEDKEFKRSLERRTIKKIEEDFSRMYQSTGCAGRLVTTQTRCGTIKFYDS